MSEPLTYTAEREAQIFGYTYLTKHNMWEVQNEIDALRAEVKKKDDALAEVQRRLPEERAMRKTEQRLAQWEKVAKELAEGLGKCVYAIDDDGRLSDARDIARAALAAYTEHKGGGNG